MGLGSWLKRMLQKSSPVVSLSGHPVYYHTKRQERPFGAADVPAHWVEARERHYEEAFGSAPVVWHEIISQVPHIDVYVYPPAAERGRDYYTLITGGMSDLPMHLPEGVDRALARAELLMYVREIDVKPGSMERPWQVGLLQFLARMPFEYETWLAEGHTIPNGNPAKPFVPGSTLTTSLLMPAIFESREFQEGLSYDGEPVQMLWLNPITDAECSLKLARGSGALYDLMIEHQPPQVLDPFRKSMV